MKNSKEDHLTWLYEKCPNDLGDDDHRWGWANLDHKDGRDGVRDIYWIHRCSGRPDEPLQLGMIDVSSGHKHQLIQEDPLYVEASISCPLCKDHGYIRDGRWEAV